MGKRKASISPSNSMLVPLQSMLTAPDDYSDRRQLAIVPPCTAITTATTTTTTTSRFSRFKLPDGWGVEEVPRSDPSRTDKYYYEPGTGNKFRSLRAVERYINGEACASQPKSMMWRSPCQHPRYSKMIIYGGKLMKLDVEDFNHGQQAILASTSTSMSTINTIPDGWVVEHVPRRTGHHKDKYYYEPGTGRQFRSQVSVMRHLAELNEDMPLSAALEEIKENRPLSKAFKFGNQRKKNLASNQKQTSHFADPPKKINWVLASPKGDAWNPFICERPVPDSVKVQWGQIFKSAMGNEGHGQPCSGASR